MMRLCVGPWLCTCSNPVMDMPPMIGINVAGIDLQSFDCVDDLEKTLDLGPAFNIQQNLTAGAHEWQSLERLASADGAQNVDARQDGAIVIGCPANECEDGFRRERDDAAATVENLLTRWFAKPNPVFDLLLDPGQFDMGEVVVALCARTCAISALVVCSAGHNARPLSRRWLPTAAQNARAVSNKIPKESWLERLGVRNELDIRRSSADSGPR